MNFAWQFYCTHSIQNFMEICSLQWTDTNFSLQINFIKQCTKINILVTRWMAFRHEWHKITYWYSQVTNLNKTILSSNFTQLKIILLWLFLCSDAFSLLHHQPYDTLLPAMDKKEKGNDVFNCSEYYSRCTTNYMIVQY